MIIAQNGPQLTKAADQIDGIARRFQEYYTRLFDEEISRNLGTEDEEGKIWYGPLAMGCKTNALGNKPRFESMYKDLIALRDTLYAQVNAWSQQQKGKY